MPSCSVIIVSYNTGPVLFASLKSVLRQQLLAELILVDNGNPPATLARLQQMTLTEPRLKVITGHGNIGIAKASNMGAKQASGDFLLFMHPDCLIPPEALADCMMAFDEVPGTMLAGCTILNPDGSEQNAGNEKLLTVKSLFNGLPSRREMPVLRQTHEVETVPLTFMCIRTPDFNRLGGFDEEFFLQVADLDLCMRAHKAGGKIICVSQVKVTHIHTSSRQVLYRDLEWHQTKGYLHYFKKHFRAQYFPGAIQLICMAILIRYMCMVVTEDIARLGSGKPDKRKSISFKRLMVLASGIAELSESNDLHGKQILITGATSEIGLCVMRRLLASGALVLALSRGDPIPFQHERLRWIKDDLDNKTNTLHGYYADMVVHCAPLWYLPSAIPMLQEAGVTRLVAFGSTSVFVKPLTRSRYERQMADKLGKAEKEIEALSKEKEIKYTLLRPTVVYGVGLDSGISLLYKIIRRLGMVAIYPPALGRCHPVHADDLALAVIQTLSQPSTYGKGYNLSGGEIITYNEMLERLFKLCHKKVRIIEWKWLPYILEVAGLLLRKRNINSELAYRMNEDLLFFHENAKKDFGFLPRSFLSGGIRDIEGF